MVQTEIAPAKSIFDVQKGDIWQLGAHRLLCDDNANVESIERLTRGIRADLVFTSPPYLQQRQYTVAIECWDTMMQRMALALPVKKTTQILINLGLVHRQQQWLSYWDGWLEFMNKRGWRRFGWYVWDKMNGLPGQWHGRLSPCHEFIFHLNRTGRIPNKTVPCRWAGSASNSVNPLHGDERKKIGYKRKQISPFKPLDSVLRIQPEKRSREVGHPAMFPIALPISVIDAYTSVDDIIFDPFVGSATTILAAERSRRICLGAELSPEYCAMALERWLKMHPEQMPALVDRTI